MRTANQRAREAYADQVGAAGPSYANAAASVRAGYTNVWVQAGIDAIALVLRLVPDDADEDPQGHRA